MTGTTTISSATFDVVLDDAANNFTGAVSVTAKDVTLVDTDAIILGASTVTGNLNVTAKGVTDTGTLSVTGTTTISSATFDVDSMTANQLHRCCIGNGANVTCWLIPTQSSSAPAL